MHPQDGKSAYCMGTKSSSRSWELQDKIHRLIFSTILMTLTWLFTTVFSLCLCSSFCKTCGNNPLISQDADHNKSALISKAVPGMPVIQDLLIKVGSEMWKIIAFSSWHLRTWYNARKLLFELLREFVFCFGWDSWLITTSSVSEIFLEAVYKILCQVGITHRKHDLNIQLASLSTHSCTKRYDWKIKIYLCTIERQNVNA